MKQLFALMILSLAISACSGGGGNGGGQDPLNRKPSDVLNSCKNVITDDLVKNYNSSQTDFRISSSGYSMRCRAEVTVNGHTTIVERVGHPNIQVYPRMHFLKIDRDANIKKFLLHTRVVPVTEDDIRKILKSLEVEPNENRLQYDTYIKFPFYARFGEGSLYYLSEISKMETPQGLEVSFSVTANDSESFYLDKKLLAFANNSNQIEFLWRLDQLFYRQTFSASDLYPSNWSNIDGYKILDSYIHKSEISGTVTVLENAISNALYWNLDGATVNTALPELYNFADGQWLNPTFADNTINSLVDSLNYIVRVNPKHSRKPVLTNFTRLQKYYDRQVEAMETTIAYLEGKLWSSAQFEQIVAIADRLYPKIGGTAWKLSETILKKANYDQVQASFFASVTFDLLERDLIPSNRDVENIWTYANNKILAGLNSGNLDFYFKTFDFIYKDLRSSSQGAEKAADQWVLTGVVNTLNYNIHFNFLKWLKEDIRVGLNEAIDTVNALIQKKPLDDKSIDLFKKCLSWLNDDLYLPRDNAMTRTKDFMSLGMTEHIYENFKALVSWYTNNLYINKNEALNRVSDLIFKNKITAQQTVLLREIVNWMINDLYVTKSNALDRGESYSVSLTNPLTVDSLRQFKDLVNWLVNDLYQNKNDALQRADKLMFIENLKPSQLELFKQAANWLINDLYISKNDALSKSESYLLNGHMTSALFKALKIEYQKQIDNRNAKSEALNNAEKSILGL